MNIWNKRFFGLLCGAGMMLAVGSASQASYPKLRRKACQDLYAEVPLSPFATKRVMLGVSGGLFAWPKVSPDFELEMSLRLFDKLWFWMGGYTPSAFGSRFFDGHSFVGVDSGLKYYVPFSDKTAFYGGVGASVGIVYGVTLLPFISLKAGVQHYLTDTVYLDLFSVGNVGQEGRGNVFRCGLGIGVSF